MEFSISVQMTKNWLIIFHVFHNFLGHYEPGFYEQIKMPQKVVLIVGTWETRHFTKWCQLEGWSMLVNQSAMAQAIAKYTGGMRDLFLRHLSVSLRIWLCVSCGWVRAEWAGVQTGRCSSTRLRVGDERSCTPGQCTLYSTAPSCS